MATIFKKENLIKKPVLEGFEHNPQLNNNAVPAVCTPRKSSEAKASKAEHHPMVEELLPVPSSQQANVKIFNYQ